MDLSRAPLPDEGSADVEADAKATTNPLDSFGLLRDRLRCGECGRLTIPRRPLLADMARFVDEVPTSDECATCAYIWIECAIVVTTETLAGRGGE
jgi:hypothetical protein